MSDRNSAGIYGDIFKRLASSPTEEHLAWARKFWKESLQYDFSPDQMDCDKALQKLGLARKRVDPDYPEDGKIWHYGLEGKDSP